MMGKTTVNLQDSFLNQVRKDNSEIEMVLVNGTHLTGLVRGFDNFTVIVNAGGKQHLVYKHAIAQIVSQRPLQEMAQPAQGQPQQQQGQQPQPPREREPREQRERRPPREHRDRGERPQRGEGERERASRENKPEQQAQAKDKFNVLDLSDVKLPQEKS